LTEDAEESQQVSLDGTRFKPLENSTDACLTPYHVERGKLFVKQRRWNEQIDVDLICKLISYTQFPIPESRQSDDQSEEGIRQLAGLVGSADLIGQLADPHYDKKIPCLFYEFLETGAAAKFGYNSPGDLRESYPSFFYNFVKPHIGDALKYLNATDKGRQWVSNLNYHVFSQTHRAILDPNGIKLLTEIAGYTLTSKDIEKNIRYVLGKVCEYQGWPIGHAYKVVKEKKKTVLRSTKIWNLGTNLSSISTFKEISNMKAFKPGEGLPGRVYSSQKPEWILDVTKDRNFPRAQLADDIGVKGAFAFPVFTNEGVSHVLEFYNIRTEEPNQSVLSFMQQVSYEIGKMVAVSE
jgi:hypothetical protein